MTFVVIGMLGGIVSEVYTDDVWDKAYSKALDLARDISLDDEETHIDVGHDAYWGDADGDNEVLLREADVIEEATN